MKCKSCGAQIRLTDKKCSHCGRVLTETAGYQADMEFYEEDTSKTKQTISSILSGNLPIVISVFLMLLLLIADGTALYVKENAYTFREEAARKEAVRQYEAYSAKIKDYLDSGDYTGFSAFMDCHSIAVWEEPYKDLDLLSDMAKYYSSMVSAVEEATLFGPDARRYNPESGISDCCLAIRNFDHEFEYRLSDIDTDPYRKYFYDMRAKTDIIMEIYLGLDEEGRNRFRAGSPIEQEAYLEEVLMHD
jgi:hypothetical protein